MTVRPDKYLFWGGAWDTDYEMDTTAGHYLSGDASIVFKATTPASDPAVLTEDLEPCLEGDCYSLEIVVCQNDITAGNYVQCVISWYKSDGNWLASTSFFNDELPVVDTFYRIAGSDTAPHDAAFVRGFCIKKNLGFTVNLDSMVLRKMPAIFTAYLHTDTGIANGVKIPFIYAFPNYGTMFDTGDSSFLVPSTGVYSLTASCVAEDVDANETFGIAFVIKRAGSAGYSSLAVGSSCMSTLANTALASCAAFTGLLEIGDRVRVWVLTSHAGNLTISGNAYATGFTTAFSGTKVA
jgi:hypothetical protein